MPDAVDDVDGGQAGMFRDGGVKRDLGRPQFQHVAQDGDPATATDAPDPVGGLGGNQHVKGCRQRGRRVHPGFTLDLAGGCLASRLQRQTCQQQHGKFKPAEGFPGLRQRQAAAKAWLAVWAAHEALHEAEHEVTVMSDFLTKIEHGAQVGTHTQVDVAEARAYLSEARLQALTIEGEAFDQGVELGRVLGIPTATPLLASGDPLQPPLPELGPQTRQLLLNRTETLPEVAWRQQQAQAELLRAAETQAQHGTQLQLGAQWTREPNVPYAILGTAQLQLPVFNRGERDRGEQLATAARLRGLAQDAAVTARTELVMTLHEVEHSHELWLQLHNHTVPASETNLRLRERLLQVGEGTVLETLLARRAVAAAKGRAARAWATLSLARYKLWLYWQALGSPQPTAEPALTPATSTGAR